MYAVIEEGKVGRRRRHDSESIEIVAQKEWKVVELHAQLIISWSSGLLTGRGGAAETRLLSAKC